MSDLKAIQELNTTINDALDALLKDKETGKKPDGWELAKIVVPDLLRALEDITLVPDEVKNLDGANVLTLVTDVYTIAIKALKLYV